MKKSLVGYTREKWEEDFDIDILCGIMYVPRVQKKKTPYLKKVRVTIEEIPVSNSKRLRG